MTHLVLQGWVGANLKEHKFLKLSLLEPFQKGLLCYFSAYICRILRICIFYFKPEKYYVDGQVISISENWKVRKCAYTHLKKTLQKVRIRLPRIPFINHPPIRNILCMMRNNNHDTLDIQTRPEKRAKKQSVHSFCITVVHFLSGCSDHGLCSTYLLWHRIIVLNWLDRTDDDDSNFNFLKMLHSIEKDSIFPLNNTKLSTIIF